MGMDSTRLWSELQTLRSEHSLQNVEAPSTISSCDPVSQVDHENSSPITTLDFALWADSIWKSGGKVVKNAHRFVSYLESMAASIRNGPSIPVDGATKIQLVLMRLLRTLYSFGVKNCLEETHFGNSPFPPLSRNVMYQCGIAEITYSLLDNYVCLARSCSKFTIDSFISLVDRSTHLLRVLSCISKRPDRLVGHILRSLTRRSHDRFLMAIVTSLRKISSIWEIWVEFGDVQSSPQCEPFVLNFLYGLQPLSVLGASYVVGEGEDDNLDKSNITTDSGRSSCGRIGRGGFSRDNDNRLVEPHRLQARIRLQSLQLMNQVFSSYSTSLFGKWPCVLSFCRVRFGDMPSLLLICCLDSSLQVRQVAQEAVTKLVENSPLKSWPVGLEAGANVWSGTVLNSVMEPVDKMKSFDCLAWVIADTLRKIINVFISQLLSPGKYYVEDARICLKMQLQEYQISQKFSYRSSVVKNLLRVLQTTPLNKMRSGIIFGLVGWVIHPSLNEFRLLVKNNENLEDLEYRNYIVSILNLSGTLMKISSGQELLDAFSYCWSSGEKSEKSEKTTSLVFLSLAKHLCGSQYHGTGDVILCEIFCVLQKLASHDRLLSSTVLEKFNNIALITLEKASKMDVKIRCLKCLSTFVFASNNCEILLNLLPDLLEGPKQTLCDFLEYRDTALTPFILALLNCLECLNSEGWVKLNLDFYLGKLSALYQNEQIDHGIRSAAIIALGGYLVSFFSYNEKKIQEDRKTEIIMLFYLVCEYSKKSVRWIDIRQASLTVINRILMIQQSKQDCDTQAGLRMCEDLDWYRVIEILLDSIDFTSKIGCLVARGLGLTMTFIDLSKKPNLIRQVLTYWFQCMEVSHVSKLQWNAVHGVTMLLNNYSFGSFYDRVEEECCEKLCSCVENPEYYYKVRIAAIRGLVCLVKNLSTRRNSGLRNSSLRDSSLRDPGLRDPGLRDPDLRDLRRLASLGKLSRCTKANPRISNVTETKYFQQMDEEFSELLVLI